MVVRADLRKNKRCGGLSRHETQGSFQPPVSRNSPSKPRTTIIVAAATTIVAARAAVHDV